jgi:hypothetical protein
MSSQTLDPQQAAADLRQELGRKRTELVSHATFLTFEPGLYAIEFRSVASGMSDVGLPLPCARLEPVPNPANPGRVFVVMTPEGGWLSRQTATAHVMVVGGRAGAVMTIYRATDGMPLPEIRFRSVLPNVSPPAAAAAPAPPAAQPTGPAASLMIHLEGVGDRVVPAGEWAGDTNGERCIEGFAINLPADLASSDLEYQGIMGEDWRTPWIEAGAFCGSRGLQLPLLGFRLRLVGAAAERYELRAWGHFARHGAVGPLGSGEDCQVENRPLTAMRLEFSPATSPADPDPEPVQAKPVATEAAPKRSRLRRR